MKKISLVVATMCIYMAISVQIIAQEPKPASWVVYNVPAAINTEKTVPVKIYFPKDYSKSSRTIIALHEYEGSMNSWPNNTNIAYYGNMYNFVIVCPHMPRTVYESQYFDQTTIKWNEMPAAIWIGSVLIPYLSNTVGIKTDKRSLGVCGFSIGARGALRVAQLYKSTVGAIACLSGYYDMLSHTKNSMFTAVYGKYTEYQERWAAVDNAIDDAKNLNDVSVFLAHGNKDSRVPMEQTFMLALRLKQLQKEQKGGYNFSFVEKKYKMHDWNFCQSVLPEMMAFFNENLK
ncbi:MAG: alpha/beta hydrolase-fold protein [Spirochaetes bacterium]|nr:alpha/beta hydrolase-fold protein [Spirochaetota bacterium]